MEKRRKIIRKRRDRRKRVKKNKEGKKRKKWLIDFDKSFSLPCSFCFIQHREVHEYETMQTDNFIRCAQVYHTKQLIDRLLRFSIHNRLHQTNPPSFIHEHSLLLGFIFFFIYFCSPSFINLIFPSFIPLSLSPSLSLSLPLWLSDNNSFTLYSIVCKPLKRLLFSFHSPINFASLSSTSTLLTSSSLSFSRVFSFISPLTKNYFLPLLCCFLLQFYNSNLFFFLFYLLWSLLLLSPDFNSYLLLHLPLIFLYISSSYHEFLLLLWINSFSSLSKRKY